MASPEYHVIAIQLVGTQNYVASYLCTLSIVSQFLGLADIKVFSRAYSQIIAASDWPRFFAPSVFLFSISLLFVKLNYT